MNSSAKIHWVSGKGGVGKSTFSYLKAKQLAATGQKTLLVEIGDRSFFSYVCGREIRYEPVEVEPNLYICHWNWQSCLKEYVSHLVKVTGLVDIFFENAIMKNIIEVAPGLAEISILGKLTSGIRDVGPKFDWDKVVFDAHSTGHTIAYLKAPNALHESIGIGPLGQHAKGIDDVLHSANIDYYAVCLPEDMPVVETVDFVNQCKKEFNLDFKIVMNQLFAAEMFDKKSDHEAFNQYLIQKQSRQEDALQKIQAYDLFCKIPYIGKESTYALWTQKILEATNGMA